MRVLVTGDCTATTYEDRMWLYAGLSLLHSMSPVTEVIEGGANGFDLHARNWALWRQACGDHIVLTTVLARWEKHGLDAGYVRNAEMVEMRPDVVLECPGSDGNVVEVATAHQLRIIRLEKMPVMRIVRNPGFVPGDPRIAACYAPERLDEPSGSDSPKPEPPSRPTSDLMSGLPPMPSLSSD